MNPKTVIDADTFYVSNRIFGIDALEQGNRAKIRSGTGMGQVRQGACEGIAPWPSGARPAWVNRLLERFD